MRVNHPSGLVLSALYLPPIKDVLLFLHFTGRETQVEGTGQQYSWDLNPGLLDSRPKPLTSADHTSG